MFDPLPNRGPETSIPETRNPWAVVDLIVFGVFLLGLLVLLLPFARLPMIYLIPLQGVFNLLLVAFIAAWVRIVRHRSFSEYVRFVRSRTFSTRALIILGIGSAVAVSLISAFLPSAGETPLEKLLTSRSAILMYGVFGVAVAPLLEEIIFRGFLFKVLSEIGGAGVAVSGTAAIFASFHVTQLAGNWGAVALILAVGCLLSVVRHRSNSIISSFIVHTSYNSVLFILFALYSLAQKASK